MTERDANNRKLCDRCGKRGECRQVDVVGGEADDFFRDNNFCIMRIGELCVGCRKDLIRTIRAWARNGTRYNRPGIVRGK